MSGLCFIDTETTGLNPFVHQAYEVAWAMDDGEILTFALPHTLENADPQALKIGGYFERGFHGRAPYVGNLKYLARDLVGVTLVGSNPAFDAAFLTRSIGVAVWHHRMVDVSNAAMWVFGWDRPKGLADVADELRNRGYEIAVPDHTASGDVAATRDVFYALRAERDEMATA